MKTAIIHLDQTHPLENVLLKRAAIRLNELEKPDSIIFSGRARELPKELKCLFSMPESPDFLGVHPSPLTEVPFQILIVENGVIDQITLQTPPELCLSDFHIHTSLAYCNVDMNSATAVQLGKFFGLKSMAFTEHSGQLYVSADDYWHDRYNPNGLASCKIISRTAEYRQLLDKFTSDVVLPGYELDSDQYGRPIILPEDFKYSEIRLAAIHQVMNPKDLADGKREFMLRAENLCAWGLDILAHPFRVFQWNKHSAPKELYRPLAKLLHDANVAAELNFHANTPDPDFYRICLEEGTMIALGSDSHQMAEIGNFHQHLNLLKTLNNCKLPTEQIFRHNNLRFRKNKEILSC
ncbi:MAG: hypothetical protein LBM70_02720 [Victivallales bacterium]|jgi:histidinol phosphatase-like PHP family hydrolase|nr:hypothetical protein [Victivallales bacterium]